MFKHGGGWWTSITSDKPWEWIKENPVSKDYYNSRVKEWKNENPSVEPDSI